MGQAESIPRHLWVRVPVEFKEETYLVQRTSGDKDPGWRLVPEEHPCGHVGVMDLSATKHKGLWHLYIYNGHNDPVNHRCAWKRLEKIEPMRLIGNQNAIKEWRKTLIEHLEAAEACRAINELTRELNLIRL
jgi:hypothetical protein